MNGMTGIGFSKTADKKISGTLPSKKTLLILILICFSVTMSSCVYLRILALRKQFTQFDKYIVVDKKDGLTFSFLRPTLYGNDIKWLGLYPVSQKTKSGVTIWKHILEKMYNDNQAETGSYDFPIDTRYQNEKLHAIYFPESFFTALSKDFFIALCKYMGQSDMDLDQRNREVRYRGGDVDINHTLSSVKQDALVQQFGIPYLTENKNGIDSLEYHYRVKKSSASADSSARTSTEYIYRFTFSEQDLLTGVAIKIPILGYIELDFSEPELHAAIN
ncbi:MAG: hypothetical protein WGN25_04535 [Candidatus Electrothrix sp. GW3-4]|uniref:hypothetical protein n=1 Tax=Candidatus Electrothrix sp. GW3-4 TaxID=3126740 RepID=UPI0030D1ECE8